MLGHCAACQWFVKDPIGDGLGIGNCTPLDEYKAKGATQKQLDAAFKKLGGKTFYCGNDGIDNRDCEKFKRVLWSA